MGFVACSTEGEKYIDSKVVMMDLTPPPALSITEDTAVYEGDIVVEDKVIQGSAGSGKAKATVKNESQSGETVEPIALADHKIIKNGNMVIEVEDLSVAKRQTDSLVRKMNGYYSSEIYTYELAYYLQIRVPSANFERLIAVLEAGSGQVIKKDLTARDVTEEYTDTEIRIQSKRDYLQRYRELVRQAKTIEEVLKIEDRIRRLQEEIESAEGRLQYLSNQISYSTLSLKISTATEDEINRNATFYERFKQSIVNGWQGVISVVLALLHLWPLLIILGILLFVWLRRRKKRKVSMEQ